MKDKHRQYNQNIYKNTLKSPSERSKNRSIHSICHQRVRGVINFLIICSLSLCMLSDIRAEIGGCPSGYIAREAFLDEFHDEASYADDDGLDDVPGEVAADHEKHADDAVFRRKAASFAPEIVLQFWWRDEVNSQERAPLTGLASLSTAKPDRLSEQQLNPFGWQFMLRWNLVDIAHALWTSDGRDESVLLATDLLGTELLMGERFGADASDEECGIVDSLGGADELLSEAFNDDDGAFGDDSDALGYPGGQIEGGLR